MLYGAAVIYTSALTKSVNLDVLYQYSLHRLYESEKEKGLDFTFPYKSEMGDMTRIFIPSGIDSLTLIEALGKVKAAEDKEETGDAGSGGEDADQPEEKKGGEEQEKELPYEDVIKQTMFYQQNQKSSVANKYKQANTTDVVKPRSWQVLLNDLNKNSSGGAANRTDAAIASSLAKRLDPTDTKPKTGALAGRASPRQGGTGADSGRASKAGASSQGM